MNRQSASRPRRSASPPLVRFGMEQRSLLMAPLPLPRPRLLFDAEEGQRLQEAGMEAALSSWAAMDWSDMAERWLLARSQSFTADDLVDAIGLPRGLPGANQNNAVGALIQAWSRRGAIHATGTRTAKRPESHGRLLRVWSR